MTSKKIESCVLSDAGLLKKVFWPLGLSVAEARARIAQAMRFIDFDGTLATDAGVRDPFCGIPLTEFLAQDPYLIQTWGPDGAISLFRRRPDLPKPLLIIVPPPLGCGVKDLWFDPLKVEPEFCGDSWVWKDLASLGIAHGDVYDDSPHHVWAPGCRMISDF